MLRKLLLSAALVCSIGACGDDDGTDPGADSGVEPIACVENEDCPDGSSCEDLVCVEDEAEVVSCSDEEPCPVGASCAEEVCSGDEIEAEIPVACDEENGCDEGYNCEENVCAYAAADAACTTANVAEVCGAEGYCEFAIEQACGADDAEGVCKDGALGSISQDEATVCGCDGNSYWNVDHAAIAGVSVESEGPCADPEA